MRQQMNHKTNPRLWWNQPIAKRLLRKGVRQLREKYSNSWSIDVADEWLWGLLHIREILDSTFYAETSYRDWQLSWFSPVPLNKRQDSTQKR
jgi:hypothetical protein